MAAGHYFITSPLTLVLPVFLFLLTGILIVKYNKLRKAHFRFILVSLALIHLSVVIVLLSSPVYLLTCTLVYLGGICYLYKLISTRYDDSINSVVKKGTQTGCTECRKVRKNSAELDSLRVNLEGIYAVHSCEELYKTVLKRALSLLDASGGELGLMDWKKKMIRVVSSINRNPELQGSSIELGKDVLGVVASNRQPLVMHSYGIGEGRTSQYPVDYWSGIITVPLEVEGKLLGVLSLTENNPLREFTNRDVELLLMFAGQAAMALNTVQLLEKARRQAEIDSLTGLYNHRHFFIMAKNEINRAKRYKHSLSVIMFDLDNFKTVNDTYGHLAGDMVLQFISNTCGQLFRNVDLVGRYGGEEFIVLLPETDLTMAKEVAERLRKTVGASPVIVQKHPISVTLSLGIACLDERCRSIDELVMRADNALYKAKSEGRNNTCVWKQKQPLSLKTETDGAKKCKPDIRVKKPHRYAKRVTIKKDPVAFKSTKLIPFDKSSLKEAG